MLIKSLARIIPIESYHPDKPTISEGQFFYVNVVSDAIEIMTMERIYGAESICDFIAKIDGEHRNHTFKISFEQYKFFREV